MNRSLRALSLCVLLMVTLVGCFDVPASTVPAKTSEVEDWRDEVIYQVLVDRFDNGDKNNDYNLDLTAGTGWHGGDWQGLINQLDYMQNLGVTTLWISPAVKNVEMDAGVAGYHGYWTQNFMATNPHFGDLQKMRELVDAAHSRGMKVILDVVTNHIGQLFYYDINLNGGPDINTQGSGYCYSPELGVNTDGFECGPDQESRLVRVTEWDPDFDPRGVQAYTSLGESGPAPMRWVYMPEVNRVPTLPEEFQNPDWYNLKGRVVTPWGWNFTEQVELGDFPGGLKDLKTTNPEVREALVRVFTWWVEQTNIDGFRIDTVKHVEHEFWQVFTKQIRENLAAMGKRNFLMFGEVFDGDDALMGSYTKDQELDSVFYFSQKFQIFDDVFKRGAPTKKIEELFNLRAVNYGTTGHPNGVVDSNGQPLPPTSVLVNFMDNHDVPRFLYDFNDVEALKTALSYLLTMDGIPCLYYGTEQGFNGGNDPANREDMWREPSNPGFINYGQGDAFSPFDQTHPVYTHIASLTALRKQLAPLRRGDFQIKWTSERTADEQDAGMLAFERSYNGETVLVVINTHGLKSSTTSATSLGGSDMGVSFPSGTTLKSVWGQQQNVVVGADQSVAITLPARSATVLVVQ